MSNYQNLKMLARAAEQDRADDGARWPVDGDYFDCQSGVEFDYLCAVSPTTALALIANYEELKAEVELLRNQVRGHEIDYVLVCAERDALMAEVEALRAKLLAPAMIGEVMGRNRREMAAEAYRLKLDGMIEAQKACDRISGDYRGRSDRERKGAGECSGAIRALIDAMSKEASQ